MTLLSTFFYIEFFKNKRYHLYLYGVGFTVGILKGINKILKVPQVLLLRIFINKRIQTHTLGCLVFENLRSFETK